MKNLFHKIIFFAASAVMALLAGAFMHHIGADMYQLSAGQATAVGALAGSIVFATGYASDYLPAAALYMAIAAKRVNRMVPQNNLGGLADGHYYAYYDDIETFPEALTPNFLTAVNFAELVTIPVDDPFVMKTGKYFHKFPCSPEEGTVKSTFIGPADSPGFENTAGFGNGAKNPALLGKIAYVATDRLILLSVELNGDIKVVGTVGSPARLATAEVSNGGKSADGNLVKHSFKSMSPVPCPTYLGPIPLDPTEA